MYNCRLKDKLHDKTSHRFYKHFIYNTEENMEGSIYIVAVSDIKEDLTSKTWHLMTYEDENDIVFSLCSTLSTRNMILKWRQTYVFCIYIFIYVHTHAHTHTHKKRSHLKDVWYLDLSKITIIMITKLTFGEQSNRIAEAYMQLRNFNATDGYSLFLLQLIIYQTN
jgi:hypothetical protein